jgi:hypothetical protein
MQYLSNILLTFYYLKLQKWLTQNAVSSVDDVLVVEGY